MGRMTCELHRPGMTALHRVGLGGLYMTLDAFDRDPDAKSILEDAGVAWELDDRAVSLEFVEGRERAGMARLLSLAFQIDDQGFFKFPGIEWGAPQTLEQKVQLYQALLGTFLQHGRTRAIDKSKKGVLTVEIDGNWLRIPEFAPLTAYNHQTAEAGFWTPRGKVAERVRVVGSLYPGGAQRHTASGFSSTCLEEPPELAFCLLFAPVGGIFFQVASRRRGRKARTALVLPTVKSLRGYARLRRYVARNGVLALTAASPTDAALRLAVMVQGHELAETLGGPVRVMAFGIVTWNEKQKSRTSVYAVDPGQLPGLRNYELASRIFKNRWQKVAAKTDRRGRVKEPAHHFVRPFTAREIVSDNVAGRRSWYAGFADYLSGRETRIPLQFERKELFQMTREAEYDHPNERIFIQTCHEAWRRRLGQLGERARREGVGFTRIAGGEYERLRVTLARCKTAATLRAALTDFWSRAGSLPSLQQGWGAILPLLEEEQWRKARDLALLALASYQPATPEERDALTESTATDAQGEQ